MVLGYFTLDFYAWPLRLIDWFAISTLNKNLIQKLLNPPAWQIRLKKASKANKVNLYHKRKYKFETRQWRARSSGFQDCHYEVSGSKTKLINQSINPPVSENQIMEQGNPIIRPPPTPNFLLRITIQKKNILQLTSFQNIHLLHQVYFIILWIFYLTFEPEKFPN